MKYLLVILVLFTSIRVASAATATATATATEVNSEVSKIERFKESSEQLIIRVASSEVESMPPTISYYFDRETKDLRLARITSSKGVFLVVYSYYFKDGKPLKYLVEYIDHPENLPKQAIIYSDEKIIWSNVEVPVQDPNLIQESFRTTLKSITRFN